MAGLFTFAVDLPSGPSFAAIFVLGLIPAAVGLGLLWSSWRSPGRSSDPNAERIASLKEQVVWRAMARGGEITAAEAAAHTGMESRDAEYALMLLVSEGRARVEPGPTGEIVYHIDSPLPGDAS